MLGLTAITMSACDDKPMVIVKEVDPIIKRDTTYLTNVVDTAYIPKVDTVTVSATITQYDVTFFIRELIFPQITTIQEYANNDSVANIFLVPYENYGSDLWAINIRYLCNKLQELLNISPKIHGRGNFVFRSDELAGVPADSLWFVQNGWTITSIQITLNTSLVSIEIGKSFTLTATVKKDNVIIDHEVTWSSNDPSIASVSKTGVVSGNSIGTAFISASYMGETVYCRTTIIEQQKDNEYVDLGLSVKWATFNVGATKPEEYEDFYAWGDDGYQWGQAPIVSFPNPVN